MAKTPNKPAAGDGKASLSAAEREEQGRSYKPLSAYGPDDKITPPAIQTGAANPTVVGEPLGAEMPEVVPSDLNEKTGNKGDAESVTKTGTPSASASAKK